MFLIKCKCGCIFTLKETRIDDQEAVKCPDCHREFYLRNFNTTAGILALQERGITVNRIPDSSKVSVTFNISVD